MKQVTGIGGIFFKARDLGLMTAWYRDHLGICMENGYADFAWREKDRPEQIDQSVYTCRHKLIISENKHPFRYEISQLVFSMKDNPVTSKQERV